MGDGKTTSKIAIVGAGSVGATIAYACLIRGVAKQITLFDLNRAKVDAEVLDLNHGLQFVPMASVEGSDDVGVCADADCHGRVVVAMGCIQTVGFGIGPALTATLLRGHDYGPALWSSAAVLVVSLAIVLAGMRAHTRSVPTAV